MNRWLGWVNDAVAGGSSLDDIVAAAGVIPDAANFVPATTAQADPGIQPGDRNDEVRGVRGDFPDFSFASIPTMSFSVRAYPELLRKFLRNAVGGAITNTGVAPASIASSIAQLQTGNLPVIHAHLLREGQLDRLTGAVVEEITVNLPVDGEGTIDCTLAGLYHKVDDSSTVGALPAPAYTGLDDVFAVRDVQAWIGAGAGTLIDCLAGFSFTYNNGLIKDLRSIMCAGKNVLESTLDSVQHRVWYPERHKLGRQVLTGRLDFGDVRPDRELRRILRHAEKLVVQASGGPLGTTPAADEMLELTFYLQAPTGGGADPLQREGDQVSSYDFTAYCDATNGNKQVGTKFVGSAAVT